MMRACVLVGLGQRFSGEKNGRKYDFQVMHFLVPVKGTEGYRAFTINVNDPETTLKGPAILNQTYECDLWFDWEAEKANKRFCGIRCCNGLYSPLGGGTPNDATP